MKKIEIKKLFYRFINSLLHLKSRLLLRKIENQNFIQAKSPGFKLFLHVRNEKIKLPFFLKYYRALGVTTFFVVDNGSTDGTLEFLLDQPDTCVFKTSEQFRKSDFGMRWTNLLVRQYAMGEWVIVVDADEILIFPHSDSISLKDLCAYLDWEKVSCLKSLFLDLYSDRPILECSYPEEESPLKYFHYFNRILFCENKGYHGGTQLRMIGHQKAIWKSSLVKYSKKSYLTGGHHEGLDFIDSAVLGTVFHFSFDSQFKQKCIEEATREQYARKALKYKGYLKLLTEDENLKLFHESSLKLEGHQQLCDLHLMKSQEAWDAYVANLKMNQGNEVVVSEAHKVLWSF